MKRLLWLAVGVLVVGGPTSGGEDKGSVVTLDGLKSRTPAEWKMQVPSNKFRAYQFQVPRAKGDKKDAELIIFFFDGSGGSATDNVKRWKDQFRPPEGKKISDIAKLEEFKIGDVEITYLDISGTYLFKSAPFNPNAKATPLPGYRGLNVYFGSKNGPYFIRLIGPEATVTQNKKAFDDWLKAFK